MDRNQRRLAHRRTEALFIEAARRQAAGDLARAEALYREALTIDPEQPDSLHGLGTLAQAAGRGDFAVQLIGRAIALKPAVAGFHTNLGNALVGLGRLDEAAASYERALALAPGDVVAGNNLANVRLAQGRLGAAEALFSAVLATAPDQPDSLHGLGMLAYQAGRPARAAELIARAIAARGEVPVYHLNLGNALKDLGRCGEAIAAYERALALGAGEAAVQLLIANALLAQGEIEPALARYERAAALDPGAPDAASNVLLALNYSQRAPAEIAAAHRRWGEALERATTALPAAAPAVRDPGRRLRIGYVSGDFRHHPVASFLAPTLAAHDRAGFEICAYADVARPDAVTRRMQGLADRWVDATGLSDQALAERIRADGVDILVDLAGHTAHNRLAVFARRPAPVQVSWLGYPDTTGLSRVDYRLVDAITDPPGAADEGSSERLVRLEGGFHCFEPSEAAGEPAPAPSAANGFVTFGSFNFANKLTDATLDAWARLLAAAPSARLVLKASFPADPHVRERVLSRLAAHGVGAERVRLLGWTESLAEHFALYGELDIALDPFPYNGTTTTCETLWMGVPLITLRGQRHAGRVGASLLSRVGLDALVAEDIDAYVALAAGLAGDPARVAALRAGLRERMAASSLCDAAGFARKLEAAYRRMWSDRAEG